MNKRNPLTSLILASLVMLIIFAAPASAAVLQADFIADPTSGNAPLVVLFTDTSVGSPSVYMWDFGDGGTSRNKNPGHTYLEPGDYTVTLKITRGPYYSTASHTITVPGIDPATEKPMAHLTAVSKTGTAPFTVQFIDKSTGGPTAWMWYFGNGDGALSREQNPTYTYTKPGVYTVSLQVWNSQGACSERFVNYITVMPANNAPVANAGSDQVVEQANPAGSDVTLDGSGSTDDGQISPLTYTWTWNGGSAEGANPVVTLPPGTTTVTLTVFDGELSSTDTVDVAVKDTTAPTITTSGEPVVLWPPNHKYNTVSISEWDISVTDICDPDVNMDDIVITSVSSDEPEDAPDEGDGNTLEDIVIKSPQTVDLRAERQGDGNGRVYTINYKVMDASGNTATGSSQVWVPHDQGKKDAVVDDGAAAGYAVNYP
jgi:PKD repeat protein